MAWDLIKTIQVSLVILLLETSHGLRKTARDKSK
uniref:Uncharacterized protein n=1 Tax=Rhizophora mucronata TaxID=61149 RepID=A0A2P2M125_RHIMU